MEGGGGGVSAAVAVPAPRPRRMSTTTACDGASPVPSPSPSAWGGPLLPAEEVVPDMLALAARAKKVFARLRWDPELASSRFLIGWLSESAELHRKSGAAAWSTRIHSSVKETPFEEFASRPDADVPYHRIRYFKNADTGVMLWEARARSRNNLASMLNTPPAERTASEEANETSDGAAQEAKPYPCHAETLPDLLWLQVLEHLSVRDLCSVARANQDFSRMTGTASLWSNHHERLFGAEPPAGMTPAACRRLCRRSELRAWPWKRGAFSAHDVGAQLGHNASCLQVDGNNVYCAQGKLLRVWSLGSERGLGILQGHQADVTCLAYDDSHLLSGCAGGTLRWWSLDDLKCVRMLRGHTGSITACLFHSETPISASSDGHLNIWDTTSSAPIVSLNVGCPLHAICMDTQRQQLYCGSEHGVSVWDTSSATCINMLPGGVLCNALNWDPSGRLLAASSVGCIQLWDLRHGCQQPVLCCAMEAGYDGAAAGVQLDDWKLVFSGGSCEMLCYDVRSAPAANGVLWHRPFLRLNADTAVNCFQVHGSALLAGCRNAPCRLWDFECTASRRASSAEHASNDVDGSGSDTGSKSGSHKGRDKAAKAAKSRQNKYPKRRTR
eukprot:jgi/Chlat1/56/ChrspC240389S00934